MDTAASIARETVELPDGRYLIYYTFGVVEPVPGPEGQERPAQAPHDDHHQQQEERGRDV